MPKTVRVSELAWADVTDQYNYIANDNLTAANDYFDATGKAFNSLRHNPGAGASYHVSNPVLKGLRKFPVPGFKKYAVFYIPREEFIEVLRVLHGARNLQFILENTELS